MSRDAYPSHAHSTPFDATLARLLTRRERLTCALAWCDHLPHAQIAALQGLKLKAVEKRLRVARRRLRAAGIEPPGSQLRLHRRRAYFLATTDNV